MSRQKRAILGIEIHTDEVRVAELRRTGSGYTVYGLRSQSLPSGAMDGAVVSRPELIADALNKTFERIGASTRDAVLGLPAQAVTMRVLEVPQVPASELRLVVEGELKHFEILREQGGVYDFLTLSGDPDGGESQILLMAVEESIVNGYRDVAARAGLHLEGMEPLHIGMYRTAYAQVAAQASTLFLAITDVCSEIGFVAGGKLALYRRVDIGVRDLMDRAGGGESTVTNALASELKRSLDYFHRQYPSAAQVKRIILGVSEPKLEWIREKLVDALKLDVEFAAAPASSAGTPQMIDELAAPAGLQYIGAIGLAMKGIGAAPADVPSFDLTARSGSTYELRSAQKSFSASVAATGALLVLGAAGWFFLHSKVSDAQSSLAKDKATLADRQTRFLPEMERQIAQVNAYKALSKEGVPFQPVMDAVSTALDMNAGLVSIQFNEVGHIRLVGEATSEMAIISTVDRLRNAVITTNDNRDLRVFANCQVDSFDKGSLPADGIRFEVSAQYVSLNPAPETGAAQPQATAAPTR
jgi:Tfp pilus assembly PilM family ATPase